MSDYRDVRIAVCQCEVLEGDSAATERNRAALLDEAARYGAHIAVFPQFDSSEPVVRAVGSTKVEDAFIGPDGIPRIHVETSGGAFDVSLGASSEGCAFALVNDCTPWQVDAHAGTCVSGPAAVVRPVGMRNAGKRVLLFDGVSYAVDADGREVLRLGGSFEPDLAVFSFADEGSAHIAEPCSDKLLAALVAGIKAFDTQVMPWNPKWVIGLSGGLDSSVVAALLVLALGPERVIGYNLATRYNTVATKSSAQLLADRLGIELRNGSIEPLVSATGACVKDYGYPADAMSGLTLENVQARTRGHLLSTFAAIEGGVVANNGNRVESALGYATLYGDAIGALAPIADLTKVQLFELVGQIDAAFGHAVVPEGLVPRETLEGYSWEVRPSAELADNQFDPMKWFYHDWLIAHLLDGFPGETDPNDIDASACAIMERYLVDRLESEGVGKWVAYYGLDDPRAFMADLADVLSQIRKAAFKRIQAPPRICVARASAASDVAERQGAFVPSARFVDLQQRVLGL